MDTTTIAVKLSEVGPAPITKLRPAIVISERRDRAPEYGDYWESKTYDDRGKTSIKVMQYGMINIYA